MWCPGNGASHRERRGPRLTRRESGGIPSVFRPVRNAERSGQPGSIGARMPCDSWDTAPGRAGLYSANASVPLRSASRFAASCFGSGGRRTRERPVASGVRRYRTRPVEHLAAARRVGFGSRARRGCGRVVDRVSGARRHRAGRGGHSRDLWPHRLDPGGGGRVCFPGFHRHRSRPADRQGARRGTDRFGGQRRGAGADPGARPR